MEILKKVWYNILIKFGNTQKANNQIDQGKVIYVIYRKSGKA